MAADLGSIGVLLDDYHALREEASQSPSALTALELVYPKVLLLASASLLEAQTTYVITSLFDDSERPEMREFISRKALKRQYHTLFDWDSRSAKGFFGWFGPSCAAGYKTRMENDADFSQRVRSFLEIGSLRNQLVHNNYADFVLEKTMDEIASLHRDAADFPSDIAVIVYSTRGSAKLEA